MKGNGIPSRLRDKINKSSDYWKSPISSRGIASSGDISSPETSGELFTQGLHSFHRVPCPRENEIKSQTTKKFTLASRVKCSRFNDSQTKALENFDRLLNGDQSEEEDDIFSQEN